MVTAAARRPRSIVGPWHLALTTRCPSTPSTPAATDTPPSPPDGPGHMDGEASATRTSRATPASTTRSAVVVAALKRGGCSPSRSSRSSRTSPAIIGLVKYQPQLKSSGLAHDRAEGLPARPAVHRPERRLQLPGRSATPRRCRGSTATCRGGTSTTGSACRSPRASSPRASSRSRSLQALSERLDVVPPRLSSAHPGVATYALLRQLRCSPFAAAVGAIAFELNGSIAWLTNAPANPVAVPAAVPARHRVRRRTPSGAQAARRVDPARRRRVAHDRGGVPRGRRHQRRRSSRRWFVVRLVQRRRDRAGILVRGALGVGGRASASPRPCSTRSSGLPEGANLGHPHLPARRPSRSRGRASPSSSRPTSSAASSTRTDPTINEVWTADGRLRRRDAARARPRRAVRPARTRRSRVLLAALGRRCSSAPSTTSRSSTRSWSTSRGSPTSPSTATSRARRCSACACSPRSASTTSSGSPAVKVLQRIVPGLAVVLALLRRSGSSRRPRRRAWAAPAPAQVVLGQHRALRRSRSSRSSSRRRRSRSVNAARAPRARSSLGCDPRRRGVRLLRGADPLVAAAGHHRHRAVTFLRGEPRRPALLLDRARPRPNYGSYYGIAVARRVGPAHPEELGRLRAHEAQPVHPAVAARQRRPGRGLPDHSGARGDDVRDRLRGVRGQVPPRRAPDPPRDLRAAPGLGTARRPTAARPSSSATARRRTSTRACSPRSRSTCPAARRRGSSTTVCSGDGVRDGDADRRRARRRAVRPLGAAHGSARALSITLVGVGAPRPSRCSPRRPPPASRRRSSADGVAPRRRPGTAPGARHVQLRARRRSHGSCDRLADRAHLPAAAPLADRDGAGLCGRRRTPMTSFTAHLRGTPRRSPTASCPTRAGPRR